MLPLLAPLHVVAVEVAVPVNVDPVATVTGIGADTQPKLSLTITLCGPAATLVNVLPGWFGPPSSEY